jgi:hypothetical protein
VIGLDQIPKLIIVLLIMIIVKSLYVSIKCVTKSANYLFKKFTRLVIGRLVISWSKCASRVTLRSCDVMNNVAFFIGERSLADQVEMSCKYRKEITWIHHS